MVAVAEVTQGFRDEQLRPVQTLTSASWANPRALPQGYSNRREDKIRAKEA